MHELIQYVTPAGLIGLLVMVGRLTQSVDDIKDGMKELKDGVVWSGECEATHKEVDRRFERLEKKANGGL